MRKNYGKFYENRHTTKNSTSQPLQKTIFSCAQLLSTYEEKTEIQTAGMYNKHTKISKTYFLALITNFKRIMFFPYAQYFIIEGTILAARWRYICSPKALNVFR